MKHGFVNMQHDKLRFSILLCDKILEMNALRFVVCTFVFPLSFFIVLKISV